MTSLLTNMSAMAALQSLSATEKSLQQTQGQISTGLRVATAADNAAYWSISTTMKSDTSALSAVTDALNLGSSTVGVATAALNSTLTLMNKMKQDLVTARTPGTSLTQIQSDVAALQASLNSIATAASFNSVNLLDGTAHSVSIVASFSRDSSGVTSVGTIGIDTTQTQLIGSGGILTGYPSGASGSSGTDLLTFSLTTATQGQLDSIASDIDLAITAITNAGATLGATKTNIDNQATFVSALSDAFTSGVGSLIDADMNVASTRLQALQTQQQLGIQSLSIANQNSQLILKLFNG